MYFVVADMYNLFHLLLDIYGLYLYLSYCDIAYVTLFMHGDYVILYLYLFNST